jgi:hypothetical protein
MAGAQMAVFILDKVQIFDQQVFQQIARAQERADFPDGVWIGLTALGVGVPLSNRFGRDFLWIGRGHRY